MKFIASLFVIIVLSLTCFGQTAKVIALDASDSDKAKSLIEQKLRIESELGKLRSSIVKKYLVATNGKSSNCIGSDGARVLEGWSCGDFMFSEDFKYIVPTPAPTITSEQSFGWLRPATMPVVTW